MARALARRARRARQTRQARQVRQVRQERQAQQAARRQGQVSTQRSVPGAVPWALV
jgi:hypothetical protein